MTLAYIVTEKNSTAETLKNILPQSLVAEITIATMTTTSSAISLAGTLMAERSRPVLLVIDAETVDSASIHDRRDTIRGILLSASSGEPYDVFLAAPTVESIGVEYNPQQNPLIQEIINFLTTHALACLPTAS
jgi:hypothetical protein